METVYLVMEVEKEFALDIPNAAAASIYTVGDLHRFVLGVLHARGGSPDAERVWARLVRIFVEEHAIPAELVVPDASITQDLGLD